MAADLAAPHHARGLKLDYPEAVHLYGEILDMHNSRSTELIADGIKILTREDVMEEGARDTGGSPVKTLRTNSCVTVHHNVQPIHRARQPAMVYSEYLANSGGEAQAPPLELVVAGRPGDRRIHGIGSHSPFLRGEQGAALRSRAASGIRWTPGQGLPGRALRARRREARGAGGAGRIARGPPA